MSNDAARSEFKITRRGTEREIKRIRKVDKDRAWRLKGTKDSATGLEEDLWTSLHGLGFSLKKIIFIAKLLSFI